MSYYRKQALKAKKQLEAEGFKVDEHGKIDRQSNPPLVIKDKA